MMMSWLGFIATVVFWSNALLLVYVYWGYGVLLKVLVRFRGEAPLQQRFDENSWPLVTILLTVHNEESNVARRLANLMEQDYKPGRIDILVVSDGSTDRTDATVEDFCRGRPVKLVRTGRIGKSAAQNIGLRHPTGDIVILTDAGASFDRCCVRELVAAFADTSVGAATAHLTLLERSGAVAASQSMYWSHELKIRELESRLGILAVATGTAMAFRRVLFRDLPPHVGDDDIIPLDVADQGYRIVHCPSALAYDAMEHEDAREFRSRVRMTMRNWTGAWMVRSLLNPLRHPGYAFALWSHKLLRWLGSFGLVAMTMAALAMAATGTGLFAVLAFAAFLATGAVGLWASRRRKAIPLIGTIYSFLLANAGFLLGICKAISGQSIIAYR
jgi:cellulose synthase/poly-beta-1,6-N-acetylglucosamine synthase-like glycosyltransferase